MFLFLLLISHLFFGTVCLQGMDAQKQVEVVSERAFRNLILHHEFETDKFNLADNRLYAQYRELRGLFDKRSGQRDSQYEGFADFPNHPPALYRYAQWLEYTNKPEDAWRIYCRAGLKGHPLALMRASLLNYQHGFSSIPKLTSQQLMINGLLSSRYAQVNKSDGKRHRFVNPESTILLAAQFNSANKKEREKQREFLLEVARLNFIPYKCIQNLLQDSAVTDDLKAALHSLAYAIEPEQIKEPDVTIYPELQLLAEAGDLNACGLLGTLQLQAAQKDAKQIPANAIAYLQKATQAIPWAYTTLIDLYADDQPKALEFSAQLLLRLPEFSLNYQHKATEKVVKILSGYVWKCKSLDEDQFTELSKQVVAQQMPELIQAFADIVQQRDPQKAEKLRQKADAMIAVESISALHTTQGSKTPAQVCALLKTEEYSSRKPQLLATILQDSVQGYQIARMLLDKKSNTKNADERRILEAEAMAFLERSKDAGNIDARLFLVNKLFEEYPGRKAEALELIKKLPGEQQHFERCTKERRALFADVLKHIEKVAEASSDVAMILHTWYARGFGTTDEELPDYLHKMGFGQVVPRSSEKAQLYLEKAILAGHFITQKSGEHSVVYQTLLADVPPFVKKAAKKYLQKMNKIEWLKYQILQKKPIAIIASILAGMDHTLSINQRKQIKEHLALIKGPDVANIRDFLLHRARLTYAIDAQSCKQAQQDLKQAVAQGHPEAEALLMRLHLSEHSTDKQTGLLLFNKLRQQADLFEGAQKQITGALKEIKQLAQKDIYAENALYKFYQQGCAGVAEQNTQEATNCLERMLTTYCGDENKKKGGCQEIRGYLSDVLDEQLYRDAQDEFGQECYSQALQRLEKGAQENNPLALCTLAVVAFKSGRVSEALNRIANTSHTQDKALVKFVLEKTDAYNVLHSVSTTNSTIQNAQARAYEILSKHHNEYAQFLVNCCEKSKFDKKVYAAIKAQFELALTCVKEVEKLSTGYPSRIKAGVELALGDLDSCMAYYEKNDSQEAQALYKEAQNYYHQVIQHGSPQQKIQAYYFLARMLFNGQLGIDPKYTDLGIEYLEEAAYLGDHESCKMLKLLFSGNKVEIPGIAPKGESGLVVRISLPKKYEELQQEFIKAHKLLLQIHDCRQKPAQEAVVCYREISKSVGAIEVKAFTEALRELAENKENAEITRMQAVGEILRFGLQNSEIVKRQKLIPSLISALEYAEQLATQSKDESVQNYIFDSGCNQLLNKFLNQNFNADLAHAQLSFYITRALQMPHDRLGDNPLLVASFSRIEQNLLQEFTKNKLRAFKNYDLAENELVQAAFLKNLQKLIAACPTQPLYKRVLALYKLAQVTQDSKVSIFSDWLGHLIECVDAGDGQAAYWVSKLYGDSERAHDYSAQAVRLNNPYALVDKAQACEKLQNFVEAADCYLTALKVGCFEAFSRLETLCEEQQLVLRNQDHMQQAEQCLQAFLQQSDPITRVKKPLIHTLLAHCALKKVLQSEDQESLLNGLSHVQKVFELFDASKTPSILEFIKHHNIPQDLQKISEILVKSVPNDQQNIPLAQALFYCGYYQFATLDFVRPDEKSDVMKSAMTFFNASLTYNDNDLRTWCMFALSMCRQEAIDLEAVKQCMMEAEKLYGEQKIDVATEQLFNIAMQSCVDVLRKYQDNAPETVCLAPAVQAAQFDLDSLITFLKRADSDTQNYLEQVNTFVNQVVRCQIQLDDEQKTIIPLLLQKLEPKADADANAAILCCKLHEISKNTEEANNYGNKAKKLGHPEAYCREARAFINSDPEKAITLFWQAYEKLQGEQSGQFYEMAKEPLHILAQKKLRLAYCLIALCSPDVDAKMCALVEGMIHKTDASEYLRQAQERAYAHIEGLCKDNEAAQNDTAQKARLTCAQYHLLYGLELMNQKKHEAAILHLERVMSYDDKQTEKVLVSLEKCWENVNERNNLFVTESKNRIYCRLIDLNESQQWIDASRVTKYLEEAERALTITAHNTQASPNDRHAAQVWLARLYLQQKNFAKAAPLLLPQEQNSAQKNSVGLLETKDVLQTVSKLVEGGCLNAKLLLFLTTANTFLRVSNPQNAVDGIQQNDLESFQQVLHKQVRALEQDFLSSLGSREMFLGTYHVIDPLIYTTLVQRVKKLNYKRLEGLLLLLKGCNDVGNSPDKRDGLKCIKEQADKHNDVQAQYLYAYIMGNAGGILGIARNNNEFSEYLIKAANNNHLEAILNLAGLYQRGLVGNSRKPNNDKAIELFQKAKDLGCEKADFYLGVSYGIKAKSIKNAKEKEEVCKQALIHLNAVLHNKIGDIDSTLYVWLAYCTLHVPHNDNTYLREVVTWLVKQAKPHQDKFFPDDLILFAEAVKLCKTKLQQAQQEPLLKYLNNNFPDKK